MICAWDLGADLPTASCGSFRCFSVDDNPYFRCNRRYGRIRLDEFCNIMIAIPTVKPSPFLAYGNEQMT